jgi:DNA polymerase-3 subunit epsilon/CBS domain-containing protein
MPIFTAARVLSIKHAILQHSSPDRLMGLSAAGVASPEIVASIIDAQRTLLGAIIGQQLIDTEAGVPLSVRVGVNRLDKEQKAELKRALGTVEEAIGLISEGVL